MITEMQTLAHDIAKKHGFWKSKNIGEKLALISSEISEFLEVHRHGTDLQDSTKIPGFTCGEEELADVIIRVFDLAGYFDMNLEDAIKAKMEYNKGRVYKHGKKY
jgi:NTP pyrophosphatase (non-canonical NTP hydrolase)